MALRVVVLAAAAVLAIAVAIVAADSETKAPPRHVSGPLVQGPKVAAAGDIACAPESPWFEGGRGERLRCRQLATSNLLVGEGYRAVLALGDLQYEDGSFARFHASYDPSWGRVKAITRPVAGNHEYETEGAAGYFRYFGRAAGPRGRGYYSFDVGSWHLIALNSNCSKVGGCHAGSPQERWLRADLARNPVRCTVAYWHHPRFSSGDHGTDRTYGAFWEALSEAGADVVLVGHDHGYERFAPLSAAGTRDDTGGIRQFVVGTGGKELRGFPRLQPNSEVRDRSSLGVLELTLGVGAYAWRFRPAVGTFTDGGSTSCH